MLDSWFGDCWSLGVLAAIGCEGLGFGVDGSSASHHAFPGFSGRHDLGVRPEMVASDVARWLGVGRQNIAVLDQLEDCNLHWLNADKYEHKV